MAYATLSTAVVGGIHTAATQNQGRDNDEYFKGRAGTVAIENSVAVAGAISATGLISTPGVLQAGPGGTNQLTWHDRTTNMPWVLYASGGFARFYIGATGVEPLHLGADGSMGWTQVNDHAGGIPPDRLRMETRLGLLGGNGGHSDIGYNADGTVWYINWTTGINSAYIVTFEYSGGRVSAIRQRLGHDAPSSPIQRTVVFTYDGAGRVSAIDQS